MTTNSILDSFVEVTLSDPSKFLIVKETLSRIGIASRTENKLYQSCHILHKAGRYFIMSFKELFLLDGKPSTFSDEDRQRRNTIANLLEDWDLVTIVNPDMTEDELPMRSIKVVAAKDKPLWVFEVKYTIGSPSASSKRFKDSSTPYQNF